MSQIIDSIKKEIQGHEDACVKEIYLDVGELLFLGEESLKLAYDSLTEGTSLSGAKLFVEEVKATVECSKCNYKGGVEHEHEHGEREEPHHHRHIIPDFHCPECGGKLKIVDGAECILKRIVLEKD